MAVCKSPFADGRQCGGEGHAFQAVALLEAIIVDGRQALGQGDLLEAVAVPEAVCANPRHALGDIRAHDLQVRGIGVQLARQHGVVQAVIVFISVLHGDVVVAGHEEAHVLHGDRPGDVAVEVGHVEPAVIARERVVPQLYIVRNRESVQVVAAGKRIPADFCKAVGQVECLQIVAGGESVVADPRHALRNHELGDAGAVVEAVVVQGHDRFAVDLRGDLDVSVPARVAVDDDRLPVAVDGVGKVAVGIRLRRGGQGRKAKQEDEKDAPSLGHIPHSSVSARSLAMCFFKFYHNNKRMSIFLRN